MISGFSFYGIYEGICMNNKDPQNKNRIVVQVPQVLGDEHSEWARPCTPVTDNANHPDHMAHTAAQVAALLTTGSAGDPAHTHAVLPVSGTLTHPHVSTVNKTKLWNDKDEVTMPLTEHTPHRLVPRIGQKVWVMFIGGDPNFPVWMGVEL